MVLIDDGNVRLRPTQVLGTHSEIVLPRGAGGVLANLEESGLTDVNEGPAFKMVGTNLDVAERHQKFPRRMVEWAVATGHRRVGREADRQTVASR